MDRATYSGVIALVLLGMGCGPIPSWLGRSRGETQPLLTSTAQDAVTGLSLLDDFSPPMSRALTSLPRRDDGTFQAEPGSFELHARSYCLQVGNRAPGDDSSYLFAPLQGPRAGVVRSVIGRAGRHPQISQRNVQSLLWAILARVKLSDMSQELQDAAGLLLTPAERLEIDGGALGQIPPDVLDRLTGGLPDSLRRVVEAESALRSLFKAGSTYEELERASIVRDGASHPQSGVPRGRWSYQPDGYFIRYLPSGYQETYIQIYVPPRLQIERDAAGRLRTITDERGASVELVYDDAGALAVPGEANLKAYPFRSVRIVRPGLGAHGTASTEIKWSDGGWTFIGEPVGGGHPPESASRFAGIGSRYTALLAQKQELTALARKAGINPSVAAGDSLALLALVQALRDVGAAHADATAWAGVPVGLAQGAFMAAFVAAAGGTAPSTLPTAFFAVPTDGGLQPLGIGDQGGDSQADAQKKKDCDGKSGLMAWMQALLDAYSDRELLAAVERGRLANGGNPSAITPQEQLAYDNAVAGQANQRVSDGVYISYSLRTELSICSIKWAAGTPSVLVLNRRGGETLDQQAVDAARQRFIAANPGYSAEALTEMFDAVLDHERVHLQLCIENHGRPNPTLLVHAVEEQTAYKQALHEIKVARKREACPDNP